MRATTVALACLVAAGCTTKDKCRSGTVLVSTAFDSVASGADELDVTVQLDQQATMNATLPGPAGRSSGTIEVEFPAGYHAGATLQVTVSAKLSGALVAIGQTSSRLASGCTALNLAVTSPSGVGGIDDLGMPSDMTTLPVPVVTAKPDYVGFSTSLDGSGSSDPLGGNLTFAWKVVQVPSGSAIATTSLTSTSADKTAFEPDRGGLYQIALTLTANDGRSATKVTDVTVPTVPIFYGRAATTATTYNVSPHVVSSDGTNDHLVGCVLTVDGGVSDPGQTGFYGHAYQPPAGGLSEFVFLGFTVIGNPPDLLVATPTTDCTNSPPVRVDNNMFADHLALSARFSPDGKRIVYVDAPQSNDGSYRLVTVAADGIGPKRVVRSSGYFGFTPAIWLDNNTVAWLERDVSAYTPFTIFSAADTNAAGDPASNMRTQVLRCDPSTDSTHLGEINQFEPSPFGMIVAASVQPRDPLSSPPLSAVNLYRLATGDCSTTNAKALAVEPNGGLSWDFSISPDGLSILFSSTHNQTVPDGGVPEPQTDIFLVPTDGSAGPQKIAGDPLYDDEGPQFIAGGRQFTWTRHPRRMDMGADSPAVMIANADGTHVHGFIPQAAAGETVLAAAVGSNRGFDCSWIPGGAGAGAPVAVFAAALFLIVGLRRRRG